jgi:hypothetical protein
VSLLAGEALPLLSCHTRLLAPAALHDHSLAQLSPRMSAGTADSTDL